MRLYSPVDLTGNVNMIEKLVLGGTGTGDPPDPQPDALTAAPSSQDSAFCVNHTSFVDSAAAVLLVMSQRVAVHQAVKLYIVPADTLQLLYLGTSTIFFFNFKVLLLRIIKLYACSTHTECYGNYFQRSLRRELRTLDQLRSKRSEVVSIEIFSKYSSISVKFTFRVQKVIRSSVTMSAKLCKRCSCCFQFRNSKTFSNKHSI